MITGLLMITGDELVYSMITGLLYDNWFTHDNWFTL